MGRGSVGETAVEIGDGAMSAGHPSDHNDVRRGIARGVARLASYTVANSPFGR